MKTKYFLRHTALILCMGTLVSCGFAEQKAELTRTSTPITDETQIQVQTLEGDTITYNDDGLSVEERFVKLESSVKELRSDVDTISGAFDNIEKLEKNIEGLLMELKGLRLKAQDKPMAEQPMMSMDAAGAPVNLIKNENKPEPIIEKAKPAVKKAAPKVTPKTTQKTAMAKNAINDIRIGGGDKTRIVFDINGDAAHEQDFDATEGIFTVTFSKVKPSAGLKTSGMKKGRVQDVSVTDVDGVTLVAFSIKPGSKMVNSSTLAPNKDNPYTRVFFDFQ